jgi:hypothetical protein
LYFENPLQNPQPITGEYSLQAGSLPTNTDPVGWHWSNSQGGLILLTAVNIPLAQHETYLGFISGVLFGIAGGALIALFQETLEPIRYRRTGSTTRGSRASGKLKRASGKLKRASGKLKDEIVSTKES